jgi:hypothetical protein
MVGFSMRKISVAAAAFFALAAFSVPAMAATILTTGVDGNPLDEMIKNNHSTTINTGTDLTMDTSPSNFQILYHSTDSLFYNGSSGGFAQVQGNGGGFSDLTISPISNISFTSFKMNLDIPGAADDVPSNYKTDFTFSAQLFFAGGTSQTFTGLDLGTGNGSNRILITAGMNELINEIVLSNLVGVSTRNSDTITHSYDFDAIRQASFDFVSGVPEPATWAEFILGFGLVGVMLRRRRQSAVPATA